MSVSVRYTWTQDLRLFLAKCVAKRERIWKKHPIVTHDVEMRNALWSEIQQEIKDHFDIEIGIDEMKKAWKNLKDNYVRIMNKSYHSDPKKASRWYFFDAMRFLDNASVHSRQSVQTYAGEAHIAVGLSSVGKRRRAQPDIAQLSFPEIECRFVTKQAVSDYSVVCDVDPETDEMHQLIASYFFDGVTNCTKGDLQADPLQMGLEDNSAGTSANSSRRSSMVEGGESESDSAPSRFSAPRVVLEHGRRLTEVEKMRIASAVSKMRGEFQRIATINFMHMEMPAEGSLLTILKDFDEYIYNKKGLQPSTTQILTACKGEERAEFDKMFSIIDCYRTQLYIRCPEDSRSPYSCDENMKQNIDRMFSRDNKKGQHRMKVQLSEEDQQRRDRLRMIQEKKAALTEQIAEHQRNGLSVRELRRGLAKVDTMYWEHVKEMEEYERERQKQRNKRGLDAMVESEIAAKKNKTSAETLFDMIRPKDELVDVREYEE